MANMQTNEMNIDGCSLAIQMSNLVVAVMAAQQAGDPVHKAARTRRPSAAVIAAMDAIVCLLSNLGPKTRSEIPKWCIT
jgi:hypothetical protein